MVRANEQQGEEWAPETKKTETKNGVEYIMGIYGNLRVPLQCYPPQKERLMKGLWITMESKKKKKQYVLDLACSDGGWFCSNLLRCPCLTRQLAMDTGMFGGGFAPASLRAVCSHWRDFTCSGPNWRMVWVHDARRQSGNPLMHNPTYMVMKRGVDARLDVRPHGLVELLSNVPHRVNEVFPSVTPVKVNRPVILRLLGNLGQYCTRFIRCWVWLNGAELDTTMVDVQHGFYIFVQLQVAPGADAVIAEEATTRIMSF